MDIQKHKWMIEQYGIRKKMVEGYLEANNYATESRPGRNVSAYEDSKELTEIEFKLHVLGFIEEIATGLLSGFGFDDHIGIDEGIDEGSTSFEVFNDGKGNVTLKDVK